MAVIRDTPESNSSVDYVSTLAVFGCVSLLVMMLKFLGFKASLNINTRGKEDKSDAIDVAVLGAYRVNRDEFFDDNRVSRQANVKKTISPAAVQLPPSNLKPNKSTSDLIKQKNLPENLSKSTQNVSLDPRGPSSSNVNRNPAVIDDKNKAKNDKEQIKLEKKRLADQKAREKAEAQERAKQEKLQKEREKQQEKERKRQAQLQAKANRSKKGAAPPAPAAAPAAPSTTRATTAPPPPPLPQNNPARPYSTNTMQSSISTTSGPPPYSEDQELVSSSSANVTFSKPKEDPSSSWDLISQHREQMNKPAAQARPRPAKNMVMDLQYKLGDDNSEA